MWINEVKPRTKHIIERIPDKENAFSIETIYGKISTVDDNDGQGYTEFEAVRIVANIRTVEQNQKQN